MGAETVRVVLEVAGIGSVAGALVALFTWTFRRMLSAMLEEHAAFREFMAEQTSALADIRQTIVVGNTEVLTLLRSALEQSRPRARRRSES